MFSQLCEFINNFFNFIYDLHILYESLSRPAQLFLKKIE
jgi:hypothetical protein